MTGSRVILITVRGPAGHVDVGVRADATPAQLATSLGAVIGVTAGQQVSQHRSPPRPGNPDGRREVLAPDVSLAAAGVVDGDLVILAAADSAGRHGSPGTGADEQYR